MLDLVKLNTTQETDKGADGGNLSPAFYLDSLRSRRQSVDVGQELRLGHTGVTHEADVDAAADLHPGRVLVDAADQEKQQSFLDVLVAVDFRRNGARKLLVEILLLSKQTKRGQKNFQIEHL